MNVMDAIRRSNRWYDNLPEPKRTLFFLLIIVGGFAVADCMTYVLGYALALPVFLVVVTAWRLLGILS